MNEERIERISVTATIEFGPDTATVHVKRVDEEGLSTESHKIQMTPAGLRPCGACVHEGYEPGRKHCHLCQVMGLYTPKPEEAAERARRKRQNRKAREAALKNGGRK